MTPELVFLNTGEFMITGSSRPENVHSFYNPLLEWLNEYIKTKPKKINVTVDVEYLNSSSVKMLVEIFRILKKTTAKKTEVNFNWKYESEDAESLEQGKGFEKMTGHPFKFIKR